jgi:hypothetical protein
MIERRRPADHKRRAHSARRKARRRLDKERIETERRRHPSGSWKTSVLSYRT